MDDPHYHKIQLSLNSKSRSRESNIMYSMHQLLLEKIVILIEEFQSVRLVE